MKGLDYSLDKKIKLNIALLFIFRVFSIGIAFLLIPLLIDYLDVKLYGVWLTILSVTMWINYFDIGIGNGLRNKLTESLVEGNIERAKSLVSSAYVMLTVISIFAFIVFLLISRLGSWSRIFNVEDMYNAELHLVMLVVMGSVLINFILSLNNNVAYANHEASFSGLRELVFQLSILMGVLALLTNSKHGGLFNLAVIYMLSTVGSNVILSFYLFSKHRNLIPSPKYFSLNTIKPLMSLGVQFFVIQIAVLIIFATDNIIITQVLGPEHVTPYNVVFRLFSVITFAHVIIITPLWSAFTDRYTREDIPWIKSTLNKLNVLMIPVITFSILIAYFARTIIDLWIRTNIEYTNILVVLMALYTVISVWNNNYAFFLNGISRLKLPLVISIFMTLVNIPISFYFAKTLQLGNAGVILGTIVSLSPGVILGPWQTYYIINVKNKRGILNAIFS